MEWREQGILLSTRRHGESAAIVEVLTRDHGRHLGVVRGGASKRIAPVLQPGAQLDVTWRARLEEHLGAFAVEPVRSRAAEVMTDPLALAAMNTVLAIASFALPEREQVVDTYDRTLELLEAICEGEGWLPLYVYWELHLLEALGFGLDLSRCAVSGATNDLAYVSPRTGRAVRSADAGVWADRLLPLPQALALGKPLGLEDVQMSLALSGYFLEHHLAPSLGQKPLPPARQRFLDRLRKA
ncbi:MAG: DNA repair protein RecO [Dinoroseobacter sp.]|nr:DNA repair protein RecO [Dinoroseobacter sp.]